MTPYTTVEPRPGLFEHRLNPHDPYAKANRYSKGDFRVCFACVGKYRNDTAAVVDRLAGRFDLTVLASTRQRSLWERLYRSAPVPPGTRVAAGRFTATVIDAQAGEPTRVRFDFGEPLDSSDLCLYQWQSRRLDPLPPPRPGQTLVISQSPGPMGW